MKLNVYAHPCEFERHETHTCIKFQIFGVERLHSTIEDFRNAGEVHARFLQIAEMCAAKYPGRSFFVSETRARGPKERAFSGYSSIKTLEYDHTQEEAKRIKWRANRN